AEVLCRIEAETAHTTQAAGTLALILGPERLRSVLDDHEVVPLGDAPERLHLGALAEEVHDENRARPVSNFALDLKWIYVEGSRIDVGEDRARPGAANRSGRGEESEGRQDDLVAGANLQGVQRQRQGVRAGAAADSVAHTAVGGDLLF